MAKRARNKGDELVFLPLGGVGEIGMNLSLYGYGPADDREWLIVDCGVTFASEFNEPGVDLIFPDIRFAEEERRSIRGIVITHAHEDHFGALLALWPKLGVPVHMTPFAAGLLAAKAAAEPNAPEIPVTPFTAGDTIKLGPFTVEAIPVAHSIPEAVALAITTPLGTVVHTGDWKIDPTPVGSWATDLDRLRALGDAGVLALVCDSTNVLRDGASPSERDVAATLTDLVASAPGRVAVTTFASNIGRIRAVAEAAAAAGRSVVVMGRAMQRAIGVARETGHLDGVPAFLDDQAWSTLPRDRVVALLTGSQGEGRAALARIASGDHRQVSLAQGDRMIFSSRTIPGNERAVGGIQNALAAAGIEIVTDRDALVHVSGHPRRGEMVRMYEAVRPRIAVPVHGEALHLATHAKFARDLGVGEIGHAADGKILRLAPAPVAEVDEVFTGRLFRDGSLLVLPDASGVDERRKASFAGVVVLSMVLDEKGNSLADPQAVLIGLPEEDAEGVDFVDTVESAASVTFDGLPRPRRRDPDAVAESVRKAIRSAVAQRWGKKPIVEVLVSVV
jgi:ribonuclease J